MALTKPAGAFLQIIGALLAFVGFAAGTGSCLQAGGITESGFWLTLLGIVGAWMVRTGGKPARDAIATRNSHT